MSGGRGSAVAGTIDFVAESEPRGWNQSTQLLKCPTWGGDHCCAKLCKTLDKLFGSNEVRRWKGS